CRVNPRVGAAFICEPVCAPRVSSIASAILLNDSRAREMEVNALTQAIASESPSRNLLVIAAGGLLSGLLTPLTPQLIDGIVGGSGNLRMALVAVPFAVLVFFVVRRCSASPVWAALIASVVTMAAFVCAVNAAIFIDGQAYGASKIMRN